jgi:hypothetical protein
VLACCRAAIAATVPTYAAATQSTRVLGDVLYEGSQDNDTECRQVHMENSITRVLQVHASTASYSVLGGHCSTMQVRLRVYLLRDVSAVASADHSSHQTLRESMDWSRVPRAVIPAMKPYVERPAECLGECLVCQKLKRPALECHVCPADFLKADCQLHSFPPKSSEVRIPPACAYLSDNGGSCDCRSSHSEFRWEAMHVWLRSARDP